MVRRKPSTHFYTADTPDELWIDEDRTAEDRPGRRQCQKLYFASDCSQRGPMDSTKLQAPTGVIEDSRNEQLAKIFNEHFIRLGLAPDWKQASIKYRTAVIAGVRAVVSELEKRK